ncbi:short-chain dehydrogenase reductase 3b-like [Vigna radiata var. radiata]|uniref:Short-chain dehydrogenase reductase 3b-like n=1 Tax=Vigna radiata var. radiata TaxID=3916 RepID=A0A1S3TP89_VIGRR|nr:short-chain dehydrogenase reductase 3b-like [Vigna radiata var. radiata]
MGKPRLQGKVAIVTGGATGIGAEAVKIFVENGAFVVIADIKDKLGHSLATSFGSDKVSYRYCDVRDENEVAETVAFTVEKYNSLDIMFSNAGIAGSYSSILDLDLKEFDNTMAINVHGVAATIKHAARVMVARKIRGSIICTASVAASFAGGAGHEYTVSKHGVLGLVRSACGELGAYGIRVNSISPYALATPMTCAALDVGPAEVEAAAYGSANLEGITLKANHIAEAALFLASDESLYISGHNLVVDGGYSAVNRWLPRIQK